MFIGTMQSISLSLALFFAIIVLEGVGHRLGRRAQKDPDGGRSGTGTIEAAVLALLGLLLAFSFSAAWQRFDTRRELIVQESNNIGTAWLRLDLLNTEFQPALRDLFRRYVNERIAMVEVLPDIEASEKHNAESIRLQGEIWAKAVDACRAGPNPQVTTLLLPALNDMIDITSTRAEAARAHTPHLITSLVFAISLLSGLVAGYGMCDRSRLNRMHLITLAAVVSITVYVILDLGNPRAGLIRLDSSDQAMVELRKSMG